MIPGLSAPLSVTFPGGKRAQEKLRESELNLRNTQAELAHMARVMTMGELTASIAHEVNQPLAAIVASGDSCTAWLANEPPNLDKARAAASRMIQAATQSQRNRAASSCPIQEEPFDDYVSKHECRNRRHAFSRAP